LLFAERKNVDKIRLFQIDEECLPAKIHGSKKGKSGRRDALSSLKDENKKRKGRDPMPKMTEKSDLEGLTLLGRGEKPAKKLETFPNHHPARDYVVTLRTEEFTCVCPATGQPDFARLTLQYIPERKILESKSLKLYLWSFRNQGVFHEHVANAILDDLVKALTPRWCKVTADFAVRGGISITVEAEHGKKNG
jgi:7-cyano-7-deazaguanine reductase